MTTYSFTGEIFITANSDNQALQIWNSIQDTLGVADTFLSEWAEMELLPE